MKRAASVTLGLTLALLFAARGARAQDEGGGTSPLPSAATQSKEEIEAAAGPPPFSFSTPYAWPLNTTRIDASGYLLPQFELVSLPTALPRDRLQYGARGTRAGFALHGSPFEGWSYMIHLVVTPAGTESLAILSPTSAPAASITLSTAAGTSIDVEEASVGYRPAKWFLATVGVLRMPFSAGQTTPIPKQMLPFRPAETSDFQSGADEGMLATFLPFDARLQVHAGVFIGSSLGALNPNQTVRGPAVMGSISAHPLGAMSLREGDLARGPLRFALGFSTIYRPATAYDATGYEASTFKDTRLAAWLRAQVSGFYVQGEYLRRLRTDDLSGRPSVSEGGYVEASFFFPVGKVGFAPLGRAGTISTDEAFLGRKFTSYEGGLAFYPRVDVDEPEKLRFIFEYLGASVSPLSEVEREGLVQLQLEF